MRRRDLIALFGAILFGTTAAACASGARAQQSAKIWRMGFIAHGHESFYDALFDGLRDYGYVVGQNLVVERRYAQGDAALFKEFAAEMVRLHVDVIVVVTTPAASDASIARGARSTGLCRGLPAIAQEHPDALLVVQDAVTLQQREEITEFAVHERLPSMFQEKGWAQAGGLMSYGEDLAAMYRRAAHYVGQDFQRRKSR
jgi:hypothetical protein